MNLARPQATDMMMMQRAARLALRGVGRAEPNPPVGCVLYDPVQGCIVGEGWHTAFGEPHAEAAALTNCNDRKTTANGTTAYITLEPCTHFGKTPPCANALIDAGIKRAVIAIRDPHPDHTGGAAVLENAGIAVDFLECNLAAEVLSPFIKSVTTGLPWTIIKWAQTIDGKIATRTGDSQWISNPQSRAAVHRLRARVGGILTGIGTVASDDPLLTARDTRRIHRKARRIVIDPTLRIDLQSTLVQTAGEYPLTVVCCVAPESAHKETLKKAKTLMALGVDVIEIPSVEQGEGLPSRLSMRSVLYTLQARYELSTVLVEAGPGIMECILADEGLADELLVYVAPKLLGDSQAPAASNGHVRTVMKDANTYTLKRLRRIGEDVELNYQIV